MMMLKESVGIYILRLKFLRLPASSPNELSIRDASFIHSILDHDGLRKDPRACMSCSILADLPTCDD
jgi:hypothetical protein